MAGGTVGTANALFSALFGFDDVSRCRANDQNDHGNNDDINRFHKTISPFKKSINSTFIL